MILIMLMSGRIVKEPLERLNPDHVSLDPWEYALYIMAFAFCLEGDSTGAFSG